MYVAKFHGSMIDIWIVYELDPIRIPISKIWVWSSWKSTRVSPLLKDLVCTLEIGLGYLSDVGMNHFLSS